MAEKNNKKRAGVVICGAYGMGNAGDEAILEAIIGQMRSIDPDMPVTVLSRSPEAIGKKHGVNSLHMFNIPGLCKAMRRSSLYINGGGSLIQDVTSSRSLWYYLFTIFVGKLLGCKVLMYGCGIGPVSRPFNRRLVKRCLNRNVDVITLREENSVAELEAFGVTAPEIVVASDPVLSLSPASDSEIDGKMRALGLDPSGKYICFCLRHWQGFSRTVPFFAKAADYAHEKYGLSPVFVSINHLSDSQAAEDVIAHMSSPAHIVRDPMPTPLASGVIGRMAAVVSMRLHGLIFAASHAVPLVGISYDPKVTAFLEYMGQKDFELLENVTEQQLLSMIDSALSCNREELQSATERLKAIESRNTQAARRLLSGEE